MKKRILLSVSICSLGLFLALTLLVLARPSTAAVVGRWQTPALLLFGLRHATYALGWLATTFIVFLAYRLREKRVGVQPLGPATPLIAATPFIAYGSQVLRMFSIPDLDLIAFFAMGLLPAAWSIHLAPHPNNPT